MPSRICQFAPSAGWRQNHRICARKRVLQLALTSWLLSERLILRAILDLERSRSQWKKKCEEKVQENKKLVDDLVVKDELIEMERKLRQQEAAAHADELEGLKKEWQMLQQCSREKKSKKSLAGTIRQLWS
jgi:hypothetical protein